MKPTVIHAAVTAGMAVALLAIVSGCSRHITQKSILEYSSFRCDLSLEPGMVSVGESAEVEGYLAPEVITKIQALDPPPTEIVLNNSPGGNVAPARELGKLGIRIRIAGEKCDSACAVLLVESSNACLDASVNTVSFHSIANSACRNGEVVRKLNSHSTRKFIERVRFPLQTKLWHLALKDGWEHVSAAEFLETYNEKACT